MKKKIITIIAVLTVISLLFLVVACDNSNKDKGNSNGNGNGNSNGGDKNDDSKSIFTTDGKGVITGLTEYGMTLDSLDIPSYIGSEKINTIGELAFENCSSLTSVVVPKMLQIYYMEHSEVAII